MNLKIGHLSTFYHTAVQLMADTTLRDKLASDLSWKLFGTGPAIVDALDKGELDLAYIGLPPAIIGIARGVSIKCVAGGHVEGTIITGDSELMGFPLLTSINQILVQLKGDSIGVPGKGSIHDVILTDCLERSGLYDEINVINYKWADEITEAMSKGHLRAAFGTPALYVSTKHFAKANLLWPASKLWPDNPSYGILASENLINNHPDLLRAFLVQHEAASEFIRCNPKSAAKVIADFTGIVTPEFALETLEVSPRYCALLTEGYIDSTMLFVSTLKRLLYITSLPTVDDIFDLSFINDIHPEDEHYSLGLLGDKNA